MGDSYTKAHRTALIKRRCFAQTIGERGGLVKKRVWIAALSAALSGVLLASAVAVTRLPDRVSVFADCVSEGLPAPFVMEREEDGDGSARLFGLLPVKSVSVSLVERTKLIPCGMPFGVKLFTDGVMVVGMGDIATERGTVNPAKEAGMRIGDVIVSMDGKKVSTNEEVAQIISGSEGKSISVRLIRDGKEFSYQFQPVRAASDSRYKAGLWVRDSTAGIGTITFIEEGTGRFGGLGHGICDVDTGAIMPMLSGSIVRASIDDIIPGRKGTPGELIGSFDNSAIYGSLLCNTPTGVYGVMDNPDSFAVGEPVETASASEIREGKAYILSCVSGTKPKQYEIEITRVLRGSGYSSKNMVIRITDKELLAQSGGIVQGMSGSPILQDGRLVGAVTHVLVNDPTSGFGIFIENMLGEMQKNLQ